MKCLIHVEKGWDEKVWWNLLKFLTTHKCHLILMSPQIDYQKGVLGYGGTEQELKKILKQRYSELQCLKDIHGYEIGMHIHFCLHPAELSQKEKDKVFSDSYEFLKKIIEVDGIAFGWFKYDSYLEGLCWKYNLEILHSGISFHDYDLPISKFKLIENWIKDKLRRLLR